MAFKVLVTGGSGFIGTHLIEKLEVDQLVIMNLDILPPKLDSHEKYWRLCDIKDLTSMMVLFDQFQPTHVIHLAAKANLQGTTVDDFPDNVLGTSNVVECVNRTSTIQQFTHVSTQYVVIPGVRPEHDEFFSPYTAYGQSKAEGEKLVRDGCNICWTILRPSNIWGPMHPHFPSELWRYLRKRYYIHPGYRPTIKYYGYIDNAINQILKIAFCKEYGMICKKVFYITDPPIDNARWMNGFSLALSGKRIRRAPVFVWKLLALIGDILNGIGVKFPVSSQRLFRLTVNESVPYQETVDFVGAPAISMEEGIRKSVEWYKSQPDYLNAY